MKAVKLSAAILALGLVATPAAAQIVAGQPAYAIPKGVGVSINADLGYGIDPSGGENIAGRVTLGLPMIRFAATFQPDVLEAGENRLGVGAAFSLMPMPVNLSIQAGVGYGMDSELLQANGGVVIGLNVPSVALSVEPWIFPQVRMVRTPSITVGGVTVPSATNTDFGVSAGVNVGLPGGIGGHIALDYDNAGESIGLGVGLHYKISVPGLGMM